MAVGKFSFGSITPDIEACCKDILQKLRETGKSDLKMFRTLVHAYTSTTTSYVKVVVGETDEFDGTASAVVVDVTSSSNDDSGATITIVGLDDNGVLTEEDITFTDTEGTIDVMTSTTEWSRIIGIYAETALVGTVTMNEEGGTSEQYTSMAAGDLYSITTRFWLPTGYEGMLGLMIAASEETSLAAPPDSDLGLDIDGLIDRVVPVPFTMSSQQRQGSTIATEQMSVHEKYVNQAGDFCVDLVYFYWVA